MRAILFIALLLAAEPPHEKRASIAFADRPGGILDWRVQDDRTLYLQAAGKRWYRAELFSRCRDLPYAQALGFATNPDGSFDQAGAVIARGQRCPLRTLTAIESEPPPVAKRR